MVLCGLYEWVVYSVRSGWREHQIPRALWALGIFTRAQFTIVSSSETVLFWLCEISPYTGSDWYQPKHSTGTICTYLGFFPFVAPSSLGQSQLPWSWFLGPHFSVSHFPSLVIVWELPAEWEPRQVLPSLIFPFCGDPALHCLLSYVWKQLLPIPGPIFQLFSYDMVPNWPTMSWQKVKFSLAYVFETFGH